MYLSEVVLNFGRWKALKVYSYYDLNNILILKKKSSTFKVWAYKQYSTFLFQILLTKQDTDVPCNMLSDQQIKKKYY